MATVSKQKVNPAGIVVGLFDLVGIILLLVGAYQEYQVRQKFDFSELSKAGQNAARQLAGYPNSMTFIIVGAIIFGVATIAEISLMVYNKANNS